jgi:hypothetical protein
VESRREGNQSNRRMEMCYERVSEGRREEGKRKKKSLTATLRTCDTLRKAAAMLPLG